MSDKHIPHIPLQFSESKAVTLGVFDGVHRGHQKILEKLHEVDPDNGLVITFANHPDEVIFDRQVKWVCSHQERVRLLKEAGASHVLELPFNKELISVTAEQFVEHFFFKQLNRPHVVVGYDLRFGQHAKGDYQFLTENYGNDLTLSFVEAYAFEREPISSTRIREAILMGDLKRAATMLGRSFVTVGTVVKGYQRGRKLGFPTANIQPAANIVLPPFGVYSVAVHGMGKVHHGVANLGLRPTFVNDDSPSLEVHLLDFEGNLYGKELVIEWQGYIRPEKRFSEQKDLVAQIKEDIEEAKRGTS